jgi:hypothetical protein
MDIEIICPKCNEILYISKINCSIFRHAFFKNNMQQINQHASKKECENYIKNDEIIGCCTPFKIIKNNDGVYSAIICDYI